MTYRQKQKFSVFLACLIVFISVNLTIIVLLGIHVAIAFSLVFLACFHRYRIYRRGKKKLSAISRAIGFLDTIIGELRSGVSLNEAITEACSLLEKADQAVVRRAIHSSSRPYFYPMHRSDQQPLERVVMMWSVAQRHGLPVGQLLEVTRVDYMARVRLIKQTYSRLAGPRVSANLLGALPILGLILGEFSGAQPFYVLGNTPTGNILLTVGCAFAAIGTWLSTIFIKQVQAC